MTALVSIKQVVKGYTRGKQRVEVLHAIDLTVERGEFLALMGPSGSGKTTLLNLIGGLDRPDRGEIVVADGGVERRTVRLGAQSAAGQVVLAGLTAGTRLARGDLESLTDGSRVRVEE